MEINERWQKSAGVSEKTGKQAVVQKQDSTRNIVLEQHVVLSNKTVASNPHRKIKCSEVDVDDEKESQLANVNRRKV